MLLDRLDSTSSERTLEVMHSPRSRFTTTFVSSGALIALIAVIAAAPLHAFPLDVARIAALTGAQGTYDTKEGVFRISVPRSDLHVEIDGTPLSPAMGLTSWAAFRRTGTAALVYGDIVMAEDEAAPVMRAALDQGLSVTALHSQYIEETPRILLLHFAATGHEESLARSVGAVFAELKLIAKRPKTAPGDVEVLPADTALDTSRLEEVLKLQGSFKDGVFQVLVNRTTEIDDHSTQPSMGIGGRVAFAGVDKFAIMDGDFAVPEDVLQPVLQKLVRPGITVTAIHQDMIDKEPRMFLHFRGRGAALSLASVVRSALDETSK